MADGRGHGRHSEGVSHYRWNQGKIVSSHGYIKIRVGRDHPLADPNGYAYEHLLVWVSAGNPKPAPGMVIHHINEYRQDNRLTNMVVVSIKAHAAEHGRIKLSDAQVQEIRRLYFAGAWQKDLAHDFGVPHQRISKIIRGEVHKAVPGQTSATDHRNAGRLLDGIIHDGYPEAHHG